MKGVQFNCTLSHRGKTYGERSCGDDEVLDLMEATEISAKRASGVNL